MEKVIEGAENGKKFYVDHSKRGTAKCRKCKKNIPKGELRIGKNVLFKDRNILQYYHVQCAFVSFKSARLITNVVTNMNEVGGLDNISEDERAQLEKLISQVDVEKLSRTTIPTPRRKLLASHKTDYISPIKKLKAHRGAKLKILFTNADQLTPTKMSELKSMIEHEQPLIVAICEVKPKNPAKERSMEDYQISNYTMHPVYLQSTDPGRGIAVYSHNTITKSINQIKLETKFEEACFLEVCLRGGDKLLFACCYRSPTTTHTSDTNNENLNNLFRSIASKKYSHCCIVGDFNFRDINWISWTTIHNEDSTEAKFIEAVKDSFYHQHIDKPTRRRGTDNPSQLDLIFTDEEMQISDLQQHAPLGKSDHSVITFNFNSYLDYSKPKESYNYDKGNYKSMREFIRLSTWGHDYCTTAKDYDIEENWIRLKSKLNELKDKFVPKQVISSKPSWKHKGSFPISKKTKLTIVSKKRLHRKWMSAKCQAESEVARVNYARTSNKVKQLIRRDKRIFEKGIALEAKKNPKKFWSHARRKLKTKSGIAPLLDNPGDKESLRYDDKEKADILQRQFFSVFTHENNKDVPSISPRTSCIIKDLFISEENVKKKLLSLNPNKSCGPDNIHARILKELADDIASPIATFFKLTIERGKIPRDWKRGNISPIFKKGSKSLASNYRPISLTAVLCKLMESFIRDKIMKHLVDNNLLSSKQHGFISGRSTVTQLLNYLDICAQHIASGNVVDTIYLDFEKAFDTVPHLRLLGKLKAYGIYGNLQQWIYEYLTGRSQVVLVNGVESEAGSVLSGVPQGTVLGPL